MPAVSVQAIGGPTAIIEIGGLRVITDPTFDPPGLSPRDLARGRYMASGGSDEIARVPNPARGTTDRE